MNDKLATRHLTVVEVMETGIQVLDNLHYCLEDLKELTEKSLPTDTEEGNSMLASKV